MSGTLQISIRKIDQRSYCVLLRDDDLHDIDSDNKGHQDAEEMGDHQEKVVLPFVWGEYFAMIVSTHFVQFQVQVKC